MINKKAAELYLLAGNNKNDIATVLKVLSIVKDSSIEDILNQYTQIMKGEVKVAEVISVKPLNNEQRKKVEQLVIDDIKETPIFIFSEDPGILGGYLIRINDNVIDESILKKISDLSIK